MIGKKKTVLKRETNDTNAYTFFKSLFCPRHKVCKKSRISFQQIPGTELLIRKKNGCYRMMMMTLMIRYVMVNKLYYSTASVLETCIHYQTEREREPKCIQLHLTRHVDKLTTTAEQRLSSQTVCSVVSYRRKPKSSAACSFQHSNQLSSLLYYSPSTAFIRLFLASLILRI